MTKFERKSQYSLAGTIYNQQNSFLIGRHGDVRTCDRKVLQAEINLSIQLRYLLVTPSVQQVCEDRTFSNASPPPAADHTWSRSEKLTSIAQRSTLISSGISPHIVLLFCSQSPLSGASSGHAWPETTAQHFTHVSAGHTRRNPMLL